MGDNKPLTTTYSLGILLVSVYGNAYGNAYNIFLWSSFARGPIEKVCYGRKAQDHGYRTHGKCLHGNCLTRAESEAGCGSENSRTHPTHYGRARLCAQHCSFWSGRQAQSTPWRSGTFSHLASCP